jgi:hypothetical protein
MAENNDVENSFYSSKTQLRIGDYVVLKLSEPDEGWLSSPGLLDDNCFATTDPDHFENCIWEIHVQNQYSAAKEFKEALFESLKNVVSQDENSAVKKTAKSVRLEREHLNQLRRAALNEQRLNEKLMGLRKGKPIAFGDPVQLRHVKSQKFLTISIDVLAKDERENMRVYLNPEGDSLSCLGFMPRYRFDKEGHVLLNNSEVMVRVHERGGEYLHSAKVYTDTGLGKTSEVNCSLESSYWTVILYQKVEDIKGNTITAGQLITLQDPDSLSCLTVDRNIVKGEKPKVIMSTQFQLRDLRPGAVNVGTNILWFLEKSDITVGGPIGLDSDEVALRDLNSGLYMKLEENGLTAVRSRQEASRFEFRSVNSGKSISSHFIQDEMTVHLASKDLWLVYSSKDSSTCEGSAQKGRAISLSVSSSLFKRLGVHLHVGVQATFILRTLVKVAHDVEHRKLDVQELIKCLRVAYGVLDNLAVFLAYNEEQSNDEFTEVNNTDKDLFSFRQHMLREQGLVDVLLDILGLTEGNVFDNIQNPVLFSEARATRKLVKKDGNTELFQQQQQPPSPGSNELDQPLEKAASTPQLSNANNPRRRVSLNLLQSSLFGKTGTNPNSNAGASTQNNYAALPANSSDKPRETNRLSFGLPVENASTFVRKISSTLAKVQLNDESDDDNDDEDEDIFGMEAVKDHKSAGSHLAHRCLKVLLGTILNNPRNQLYVADRFPVILSQVQEHRLAVLCVEELLKENLNILQTKVRQREIDIFVELLAQYEMSVTFLRLLQCTCSCPMGVDATQRMVTHALFGYPNLLDTSNILNLKVLPSSSGEQIRQSISVRFSSRPKGPDRLKEELSTKQKLIIKIHADRNKLANVEWRDLTLYCPRDPEKHVIGFHELKSGIPELWLSWEMSGKEDEFSMHPLFGYSDKVPLELVCSSLRRKSVSNMKTVGSVLSKSLRRKAQIYQKKQSSAGKNVIVSTGQNRAQVAEYFNTQLYMVADLCLDRNYVAMIILESMYPYDLLIAMLKTENLSSSIKAAVCRIIRCLYVDREPQVEAKFPRLIRTSLALANHKDVSDDSVITSQEQYKFALIQTIISEFITEKLDLSHCDEHSAEMIKLLETLVSFSFYRSVPQILDILKPLVRIFDEKRLHKDSTHEKDDPFADEEVASHFFVFKFLSGPSEKQVMPVLDSQHGMDGETMNYYQFVEAKALKYSKVLDSLPWQMFVLCVVLASVILAIIQIFTDALYIEFYIASMTFFALDLVFRAGFYALTHSDFFHFWHDVYNVVDTLLVALDIALLIVTLTTSSSNTSAIRIVRLLRIIRLYKTYKMMRKIARNTSQKAVWKLPKRYLSIKKYEAKTMIGMLEILLMFYNRIQDKTLDVAIKAFAYWNIEVKNDQVCDPLAVFERLMVEEERISSELSITFDNVLLDTLMYSDVEVTKAAVNLLMVHKSQRDMFFQVAEEIQIVYSPKVAGICKTLASMMVELRRLGEMFEIWSDLESESDISKASRVQEILNLITAIVGRKNDDRTLGIRSTVLVDEEVQNILRNLDAMEVFIILQNALYDGGREELKPTIRSILISSNELVCLYVKNSETNQADAFQHFEWFVDRTLDGIGSSKVVRFILEGNKDLIKKCPRNLLSEAAQRITDKGQLPEFLDLFVGMVQNSALFGSRVLSIEAEICAYLTAREWKKTILLWMDHEEYFKRRAEMEKSVKNADGVVLEEELSPALRYHVRLLILFANCNLGPRLFAVYPIGDILACILDRATIFPVRRELCRLLICMLNTSIDRAERSESFWELLDVIIHSLDVLSNEFVELSKNPQKRIQRGEWIELGATIISVFFEKFELDAFDSNVHFDSRRSQPIDPRITMQKLFRSIKGLVEHHAGKLGTALTNELAYAATMINRQIDSDSQHGGEQEISEQQNDLTGIKLQVLRAQHQRASVVFADVQQALYRKQFATFLSLLKSESKDSKEEIVQFFKSIPRVNDQVNSDVRFEPLVKKLALHFRSMINKSPLSRSLDESSIVTCGWILKAFRYMVESELRFSCDNLHQVDDFNTSDSIELNNLRKIFNENGVVNLCMDLIAVGIDHSIYTEAIKLLIALMYNGGGVIQLQQTVYRYLVGNDSFQFFDLVKEMLDNLRAWTTKENENLNYGRYPVEKSAILKIPEDFIVLYLLQSFCEGSFVPIRDQIREQRGNSKLISILDILASYVGVLSHTEHICNTYLATAVLRTILRLVQGPCKGNQDQFVLHTELLISLNRVIRDTRPKVQRQSKALMEYQERLKESIVDVLRSILEGHYETSLVYDRVSTTIDINVLHLLVFPQTENVFLASNTNNPLSLKEMKQFADNDVQPAAFSTFASPAQAKYLVLVKHMSKAIDEGFQGEGQVNSLKQDITSVEVVFDQQVHIVYFHIPDFIKDISMESKNRVIDQVNDNVTGSRELKLADFLKQCKKLYRESVHQQVLKKYGLAQLWSIKLFLTRLMFMIALVINILLLLYSGTEYHGKIDYAGGYNIHDVVTDDHAVTTDDHHVATDDHTAVDDHAAADDHSTTDDHTSSGHHRFLSAASGSTSPNARHDHLYMAPLETRVILALTVLQSLFAVTTVVIFAIVHIPVTFAAKYESTRNFFLAGLLSLWDPMILWYSGYFVVTTMAIFINPLFATVLLLDFIVLDNTSQDLLKAISHPVRQLVATLMMILITLNVFSFVVFVLYRHDVNTVPIHNLWESLKLCISYGFRGEYGVDHEMSPSIGLRMFLDVSFYFIVSLFSIFSIFSLNNSFR